MIIIKRGRITFYIKDESVIVANGDFQYSSYNVYGLSSRAPFYEFKETILNSQPPELSNIVEVVELGVRCGVYGYGTQKPNLDGVECEYRP